MDELIKLLNEKKKKPLTVEDQDKVNLIQELVDNNANIFDMDPATVIGILDFLGMSENEIFDFYCKLNSYEGFDKLPKQRIILEQDDYKGKKS